MNAPRSLGIGVEKAREGAADAEAVGAIAEIARVDFAGAEILDLAESHARKFLRELGGIEKALEGLTGRGYPAGERIEGHLIRVIE